MRNVRELDQSDIEFAIRQYVSDNKYEADKVTIKINAGYKGTSVDSESPSVSATVILKDKPMNPIRAEWGDQH